jgi:hypothetical protein
MNYSYNFPDNQYYTVTKSLRIQSQAAPLFITCFDRNSPSLHENIIQILELLRCRYSTLKVCYSLLYLMLQRLFMQQFYWISVSLFDLDHYMFRPLHKAIFRWMFCGHCYTYTLRDVQVALLFA